MSTGPQGLLIEATRDPAGVLVRVCGEIDMHTSPLLRRKLQDTLELARPRLILDLREVSYIDSSGVGTIVEIKRRADRNGSTTVLVGLQPRVRNLFEITRLSSFFRIVDSPDQARDA